MRTLFLAVAALAACSPRNMPGVFDAGPRVVHVVGWDRTMPAQDPPHVWCAVDSVNSLAFRIAGPTEVHAFAEVRDARDTVLRQIFEGRFKRGTTELSFATDHLPAGSYTWLLRTVENDTLQWATFRLR